MKAWATLLVAAALAAGLGVTTGIDGCALLLAEQERTAHPVDDAVVGDLVGFVVETRGGHPGVPPVVALDPDAMSERLRCVHGEAPSWVAEIEESRLRALGVIGHDADYAGWMEDPVSAGAAAFYDAERDQVVVATRPGEWGPWVRATVVHEIVHAVQDRRGDIDRLWEWAGDDDERGDVAAALLEGEATLVEYLFLDTLSESELVEYEEEWDRLFGDDPGFGSLFLDALAAYPYETGFEVVAREHAAGGWEAVDALLARPPSTTEKLEDPGARGQIFEVWPTPVELDGFELVDWGIWGANEWNAFFEAGGVEAPAANWSADYFETWWDGDTAVTIHHITGDRATETDAWAQALADYRDRRDLGQAFRVFRGPHQVVVVASTDPALVGRVAGQVEAEEVGRGPLHYPWTWELAARRSSAGEW